MVAAATYAIAVRGRADAGDTETTWLGGRVARLAALAKAELRAAGFRCEPAHAGLAGQAAANICNGTAIGMGLQFELPRALRDELRTEPAVMARYAGALREAVDERLGG